LEVFAMPLEPTLNAHAFTDPGTSALVFMMRDALMDRDIRVTIEPRAVRTMAVGGMSPLEIFREHREALQSLASSKFDAIGGGTEVVIEDRDLVAL
jgi:hypothetical protein